MRRSFIQVLQQESFVSLAREVVWRTQSKRGKKHLMARIQEEPCPVSFHNIPYYNPDPTVFSEASRALITGFADEICEGRFPFPGYGTVNLGRQPKWNVDFVSGLDWPQTPVEIAACIRFDGSDVKAPLELSRLQFLPVLGKANVLTGDVRYREVAKDLLSCWIKENPVGVGVNWSIAMEVALRAMSICFLLNLLSPLRPGEEAWLAAVTRSLWQHLVFIEAHIEFSHLVRSNHYLSNIVGLYCLSSFLEGDAMAAKRQLYRQRVEDEILHQVYEDGGQYEASTGYQVLVTQMFTSALLLTRARNLTPASDFVKRLQSMHRFLAELASPSGQLPHFGDCDDGRVELLLDDLEQMLLLPVPDRNSLRISNLVGLGNCLFGGTGGAAEDAKWYGFTENQRPSFDALAPKTSRVPNLTIFSSSGMAIARTRFAEVLFFAAPNGIGGKGSHNHNDKLSLVLRLDGEEVLSDSGTCCYTRDPAIRNRFRSTAAHNTVVVDKTEQNTIDPGRFGLFSLGAEAAVSRIEEGEENGAPFLRASHSGYRSLGVTHVRAIRFPETGELAVVEDLLEGSGRHAFEVNFQLAPKWSVASIATVNSEIRCHLTGPRKLTVVLNGPNGVRAEQSQSVVSMAYGSTTPAVRLRFWGDADLPVRLTTTVCGAD